MANLKLIIVSDTHGDELALKKLILCHTNANLILHLGDGENEFFKLKSKFDSLNMQMVKGNCDINLNETLPTHKIIKIKPNLKIFACHGHTLNVKQNLTQLVQTAKLHKTNLALFGHTHNKFVKTENNLTILNPGSLTRPRSFFPSFATIFVSANGKIKIEINDFK